MLQPGDWLVLHTDGISEARNAAGQWFGERRLLDLLSREAAAGLRPRRPRAG
jgi:serine phosphatase RsbU (regulator of sigma subunit)